MYKQILDYRSRTHLNINYNYKYNRFSLFSSVDELRADIAEFLAGGGRSESSGHQDPDPLSGVRSLRDCLLRHPRHGTRGV